MKRTDEITEKIKEIVNSYEDNENIDILMIIVDNADEDILDILVSGNMCQCCAQEILEEHIEDNNIQHIGNHKETKH